MKRVKAEAKVYSEFFTNVAVAWFVAGVISSLFSPPKGLIEWFGVLTTIFLCLSSLKIATMIIQEAK
jgi:hypothetical protein